MSGGFLKVLKVKLSGRRMEDVWKVSGRCLKGFWKVSGGCLEGVGKVSLCLEGT